MMVLEVIFHFVAVSYLEVGFQLTYLILQQDSVVHVYLSGRFAGHILQGHTPQTTAAMRAEMRMNALTFLNRQIK